MRAQYTLDVALRLATFSVSILVTSAIEAQSAAQTPLRLSWSSTEVSCDGASVAGKALQMVAPGVMLRPVEARAEVSRAGNEWVVHLEAGHGEQLGRRTLRGESCGEIQQAIALLLAMIMEAREEPGAAPLPPESVGPTAPSPAALPTVPVAAPVPAPTAPPFSTPASLAADTPPPISGIDITWFLRVGAGAGYGLKPGLTPAVGGSAGISLGKLDLGVGGTYWPATEATVLAGPGRLAITRQNLGLRGCWVFWERQDFRLAPCLAPELTFFRYESAELLREKRGSADALVSLTGAVELRYELARRLTIWLAPGVTWETRQPFQVTLDCATPPCPDIEVYRTDGVGRRLEIGVDARF